ncbi:MAG TPA: DUF192 domain-containing protein [Acidimicrobiales bacterium]|nr:DUF192 domain-containing protein [Acidimicrobiales bacterium]
MTDTWAERWRGLRGRPNWDGGLHLDGARGLHTAGMRFSLDVALLSGDLEVLAVVRMRPWRMCVPRRGARSMVISEAGCLERWGVRVGDKLVIREVS